MPKKNTAQSEIETACDDQPKPVKRRERSGIVDKSFYLIGVGASAGGLEAIKALIGQIPADCPHSFVIIQHMSPDYKSMMGDILSRETSLQVVEVADNMPIRSGHIYILPPKANVIIKGTHPGPGGEDALEDMEAPANDEVAVRTPGLNFSLVSQAPRPQLNLPIDLFFQSLAEAADDRAIAIILSGTGSDGSRGLRAVKDAGGIVMVQEPTTAAFDGMPRAAINTHLIDMVLPPDEMSAELYRYFEIRRSGLHGIEILFEKSGETLTKILDIAGAEATIDFSQYKSPTLKRRIARRMGITRCTTLEDYLDFILADPTEVAILHREFLVGVTNFFRDRPAWDIMRATVIPDVIRNHQGEEPIKVWCVGCSTGEEVYTIAMLFDTYLKDIDSQKDFRVYGTDANEVAIRTAKEGVYPESAIEDMPAEFSKRYDSFIRGGISIGHELRKKVIFSVHNAIEHPPYLHADLLICRNMLIYMTAPVQAQILSIFSYSLKQNGYLFLGASESVERSHPRFQVVHQRWRIFKNVHKSAAGTDRPPSVTSYFTPRPIPSMFRANRAPEGDGNLGLESLFTNALHGIGACVIVVDERMQILETYGAHKKFLRMPENGFSSNLLDLVPQRLVSLLSILVRKALNEAAADQGPVKLIEDDTIRWVEANCRKIVHSNNAIAYAITVIEVRPEADGMGSLALQSGHETSGSPLPEEILEQERYVSELEAELATTRETLEATIEDLGISNEELQTSNEELVSTNEELQSTNEEMQSVNEELHTTNVEHSEKIVELEAAYADIDNLLNKTDIAIVFLDQDLRIRRFSEAITQHFQLNANDIGRPLRHFSSTLEADANRKILGDAERALSSGERKSYEVKSLDGNWYTARILPFTDVNGRTNGVVLAFVDITPTKKMQEELVRQKNVLEGVLESEAAGYWDWNIPENTEYLSPRFKAMFGYADDEMENAPESWQRIIHPDDLAPTLKSFDQHIQSRGKIPFDDEVRYLHKDGSIVWVRSRGQVIEWGPNGEAIRMVGCHFDITDLKERERLTIERAEEMSRFSYVSAHDLREPMSTIQNFIALLNEDLDDKLDPEARRMMDFVIQASSRMKSQIEGVLEYAKLVDGKIDTSFINMKLLADTCVQDLQTSIQNADACITVRKLPNAMGSETLINRVLQNLISNAIKFRSPDQIPKISISGKRSRDGMNAYRVVDNGIGIEPEYREKVFEIFSRLHTRSEYEGSGLGLAICRKIIAQLGGRIWVEDGENGGCAFVFTLPNGSQET